MRNQSPPLPQYPSPTDKSSVAAQFGLTNTNTHGHSGAGMDGGQIDYKNLLNKPAPTVNGITALTGDVAASGVGSVAATLATVNSNVGLFGSTTAIPNFTVNGKGLVTAAGTNVVIAPAGTLSGTTLNSSVVTSSLTSVGTLGSLAVSGTSALSGKLRIPVGTNLY